MKKFRSTLILTIFLALFFTAGCAAAEPTPQTETPIAESQKDLAEPNKDPFDSATEPEETLAETDQTEKTVFAETINQERAQEDVCSDSTFTCTLSLRCDTILAHIQDLDPNKTDLVPADGLIFIHENVAFSDGESVFDVLVRELKKAAIHLEFMDTPFYNSVYIEGISNLYELDCGPLSGWIYRVNGVYPSYGCSLYQLQQGDRIEWIYTCDLGADVGGENMAGQGK